MDINQKEELAGVFAQACKNAIGQIDFDVRCLDWASYTPDFFIEARD